MTSTAELARRLADIERRLARTERSSRLERASVLVSGVEVDVPAALLAASVDLPSLQAYAESLEERIADLEIGVTPHAYHYRVAAQTIANTTEVLVDWDGASPTLRGGISYNAGTFTLPIAGLYTISSGVLWDVAAAVGVRWMRIRQNGTARAAVIVGNESTKGDSTEISHTHLCAAGDEIDIQLRHSMGVSAGLQTTASGVPLSISANYVDLTWVGH